MFIKLDAKSTMSSGKDYKVIVAVDHIGSVLDAPVGCQIICKNGDMVPVKNSLADVEGLIKKALGGSGHTLMV